MLQTENTSNWPHSFQEDVNLMMNDGRRRLTCHSGDIKTI